jgi:hypothetical protein
VWWTVADHGADDFSGPEPNTLVIDDQYLRYGFIQLPKQILYARNLSRDAKMLFAVLLGYAWQERRCFPGYGRLCDDMQASENVVRKYMRELEAMGLLRQKRRGLGKTNIYTLCDLRTSRIEVQEPQESENKESADLRTADTEVQEPRESEVAEHRKSEGEIETVEVETDEEETDTSNIRMALPSMKNQVEYDEDRQTILEYVEDLAREFRDKASLKSSTTRATNLYRQSGLSLDDFIGKLQEARAITKERSASIRSKEEGSSSKHKMAYFFACLEGRLSKESG